MLKTNTSCCKQQHATLQTATRHTTHLTMAEDVIPFTLTFISAFSNVFLYIKGSNDYSKQCSKYFSSVHVPARARYRTQPLTKIKGNAFR